MAGDFHSRRRAGGPDGNTLPGPAGGSSAAGVSCQKTTLVFWEAVELKPRNSAVLVVGMFYACSAASLYPSDAPRDIGILDH